MKIDNDTLDRIAELARLDFSDTAARTAMLADMERVIGFVEKLNEVDTAGVEPLIFMTEESDVLRDEPTRSSAHSSARPQTTDDSIPDSTATTWCRSSERVA
jgi:aspartyl-tRNA(Asn)/glutamyl-tRNA(Gln) amidotransferase subunit C